MKISQYVKKLLPSLEKSALLDDIDTTAQELEEQTIPAYQSTVGSNLFTSRQRFHSPWVQKRDSEFQRSVRGKTRGNMIEQTNAMLSLVKPRLDFIRKAVEGMDDIQRDGMSYRTAGILRTYQAMRFFSEYSRKLLLMVYAYETPDEITENNRFPYSKAEILEIEQQFTDFMRVAQVISRYGHDIDKIVDKTPDITIDVNDERGAAATVGRSNLDPLQFNLTTVFGMTNPIWFVQSGIAEYQANRYKRAQEEKRSLELRLIQMKQLAQGEQDAALQQQIEYQETRLHRLNKKLEDMERKYG